MTTAYPSPLKYTGSLDHLEHFDVTPIIGREYQKNVQLRDIMKDEKMVKDLAVVGMSLFRPSSLTWRSLLSQ